MDYEEELYDEDDFMMDNVEQPIPDEVDEPKSLSDDSPSTSSIFDHCKRPPLDKKYSTNDGDLSFQWFDINPISSRPLKENPNKARKELAGFPTPTGQNVPCLRVFGVTEEGHSVCATIHGFSPYGFFSVPDELKINTSKLDDIKKYIDKKLNFNLTARQRSDMGSDKPTLCHKVEYFDDKQSIMGYNSNKKRFLKVTVASPGLVPTLKTVMSACDDEMPGVTPKIKFNTCFEPFECNVLFLLRYMIDQEISGAGWLTLPKSTYKIRNKNEQVTHCQMEVDVSYDDIIARKPEGEWSKIAKVRVLSLDIECQGRKGHFPSADQDPVIQIANVLNAYGEKTSITKNVFTLRTCLPIVGAQVISRETELEMLISWRAFLEAADPDIITGYNIQNFDIPYLLDRADTLSKAVKRKRGSNSNPLKETFKLWGRVKGTEVKMKKTAFQSAAFGRRADMETTVDGRIIFDMLMYMRRNHKLSSYTLNSVCGEFLQNQQKEDVHHSIISDLQNGTDEDRHRLATYCLQDANLPLLLMDKLSVLVNYIEMSRVTGVPMDQIISGGQQIKVFSMILRKCRQVNLLVPTHSKSGVGADDTYEGATVLDPIKGFYQDPIATLDFASLYPSIMQAWNLCYSTLVSNAEKKILDPKEYTTSDNGHTFVKSDVKKGILPTILEELLSARKQAKRDMKNAPNDFERSVQNGRQLALKVSANSVYGFTGANVGRLPCVPIASSVTSYGRILLEKTKAFVEERYTIANGYKHDATVIYGDTDSVMVKFGGSLEETFPLAIEAAEKCSEIFPHPILLEFEKVYSPYLLMNKKRYAGLMWTNTKKYDYMDTKGLETVRRDNCQLVRDVVKVSLDKIIIEKDINGAINYVKLQIADLLQNRMDISRLVITKSLNKGAEYALGLPGAKKEDYKNKQAHVELAARMKKRDPGTAPQMGDRVPYVMIAGAKDAKAFEKSEDPVFVLDNNLPLDYRWYLSNQLSKPLTRIFDPVIKDCEKVLFHGAHTRKIVKSTPTARKGNLMMFASKGSSCLGCRVKLKDQQHLCKHCLPKEAEIYLEKLAILREAEIRYAELWSYAQHVHGSLHSEIICTGDGCQCQFYRRRKVQTDVRLARETVDKFGWCTECD